MAKPFILVDITRLLSRASKTVATGIDRVEMAYAKYLIDTAGDRLAFVRWQRLGGIRRVPFSQATRFVAALDGIWNGGPRNNHSRRGVRARAAYAKLFHPFNGDAAFYETLRQTPKPLYLLVSHHHLEREAAISRLKAKTNFRLICFIHDVIPLEYPQYCRPTQSLVHKRRLDTLNNLAESVIVNSTWTKISLENYIGPEKHHRTIVAPLGVSELFFSADGLGDNKFSNKDYFICVGTIEPKKNHALLLRIWQRFAKDFGPNAPKLVLVGSEGWMVREIMRQLRDTQAFADLIQVFEALPDRQMASLVSGACATLLPSLAEGYGLPLAELLALGIPSLCSNLPVLREVGADVPEYLDPSDQSAWENAILDYAAPHSPRRAAQLRRLANWQIPTWTNHFRIVQPLLDGEF